MWCTGKGTVGTHLFVVKASEHVEIECLVVLLMSARQATVHTRVTMVNLIMSDVATLLHATCKAGLAHCTLKRTQVLHDNLLAMYRSSSSRQLQGAALR